MGSGNISRDLGRQTITISSGQPFSTEVLLRGHVLVAIVTDSAWDAAKMTFQTPVYLSASDPTAATWVDVYDDAGTEVTIAAASIPTAARRAIVNKAVLEQLATLAAFRIRSGDTGAPVNQTATRTLTIITKG